MKEREDRWGHLDPAFTQMENFRGQDDPGQWTPRAEAEEKENASLSFFFFIKRFNADPGGKDSLCSIFFYFFYWVFRIWSAAAPSQTFPCGDVSPVPHNCPLRKRYNIRILEMRKVEIREVDLHNITWLTCGCRTQNETPVLSSPCFFHYIILPALYNRKLLTSVRTSMPLVIKWEDKEIRGTVGPWTTRVWTAWVYLHVDL